MIIKEVNSTIKNLPSSKSQALITPQANSTKYSRKKQSVYFTNSSKKIERGNTPSKPKPSNPQTGKKMGPTHPGMWMQKSKQNY